MTRFAAIAARSFAHSDVGVFGLARSGMASIRALKAGGASVYAWDDKEAMRREAAALGATDEVCVPYPVAAGSSLDGAEVTSAPIGDDTGFLVLALRRDGRYFYRPRRIRLGAGDEILATGPWEGRAELAHGLSPRRRPRTVLPGRRRDAP